MNIKVFPLADSKMSEDIIKADLDYLNELNDVLFDDDYFLDIGAKKYLFAVVLVEDECFEKSFKRIKDKITNPVLILAGRSRKAFKGALELNAKLLMDDYHPLVVKGNDVDDAEIIKEVAKVMLAKKRIINSNVALIGNYNELKTVSNEQIGELSKKHRINILKIGNVELEDAINKAKPLSLPHKVVLAKMFIRPGSLDAFTHLYSGVMYLVDKYHLSGIALNVDFDPHFTYALASLVNEKGISLILENDLHGLVSLMLLNALNDSIAMYAEIINTNLEKSDLIIASKSVPFSFIGKEGTIDNGPITLAKFTYDNKHVVAFNGKITASTLIKGEMEMTVHLEDRDLFDIFREASGGSFAFTYGDSITNIFAYNDILYFENKENNK